MTNRIRLDLTAVREKSKRTDEGNEQKGYLFFYSVYIRLAEGMEATGHAKSHHDNMPEILPFTTVICLVMRLFLTRYCRYLAIIST